jgi:predicted dehydrogenase
MAAKKRYAVVGTGARSAFYYSAIAKDYKDTSEIVGFCDTNQTRMDYANLLLKNIGANTVPTYKAGDFDK